MGTHGWVDRGFEIAGAGLSRSKVLEDPDAFCENLGKTLAPSCQEGLFVEKVEGALCWRSFFDNLPDAVRFKGHTQTARANENNQEACHVFKFVRRESLGPHCVIDNPFIGTSERPCDVILLVKQYVASTQMVQRPQVCFPYAALAYLPPITHDDFRTKILPREQLSKRQSKEFMKTADLVEQPPWCLCRAAKYLRELVANNKAGSAAHWMAPDIGWVFSDDLSGCALGVDDYAHDDVFDLTFAITTPVPVTMVGGPLSSQPKRGCKRQSEVDNDNVKGAPPGSCALETGQPEGATVAAAGVGRSSSPQGPTRRASNRAQIMKRPCSGRSSFMIVPPDVQLGCCKCRNNARIGCGRCRNLAGLVEVSPKHWVKKP